MAVGDGVSEGVTLGVFDADAVPVPVPEPLDVATELGDRDDVPEAVIDRVSLCVAVTDKLGLPETVGESVCDDVRVLLGVDVGVKEGVRLWVAEPDDDGLPEELAVKLIVGVALRVGTALPLADALGVDDVVELSDAVDVCESVGDSVALGVVICERVALGVRLGVGEHAVLIASRRTAGNGDSATHSEGAIRRSVRVARPEPLTGTGSPAGENQLRSALA